MKRILSAVLAVMLLLSCCATVFAEDGSREYFFELTVDGQKEKEGQPGDVITVVFTLYRKDRDEAYEMYAMQNEIRYDSEFFRLVEGSAMLSDGISTTELGLRDNYREFYMNFVSLFGGERWDAKRVVGSFQLEVIGTSGVTHITNQDYLVSTADGNDSYISFSQDVTIILSSGCTVTFRTNGGSDLDPIQVQYGEKIPRPSDPYRSGYRLVGWYTDIDLQNEWNFDTDVVQGNMSLYAKWEQGAPVVDEPEKPDGGGFGILWVLLGLVLLALILFLLLWLNTRTVKFETGCKTKIKDQKVRKGGLAKRPEVITKEGRTFAGWFYDQEYVERWDFENDKVEENLTLYAKWI